MRRTLIDPDLVSVLGAVDSKFRRKVDKVVKDKQKSKKITPAKSSIDKDLKASEDK